MSREDLPCASVLALLSAPRTPAEPRTTGLTEHLISCAGCRRQLLELRQREGARPCASAGAELAALGELERRDPAAARVGHAQLWAHLWECAACLARYESGRGRAAPPPSLTITLSRRALAVAIPSGAAWAGPLRGEQENVFVLFDGSEGHPPRQLTIVVREGGEAMWEMAVTAAPPLDGAVLITVGVQNFAGRFAQDGTALIRNIPARVLSDEEAPDLEIALLPSAR